VEAQTINKQKLNPQQELELVAYMKDLTGKGIPPTREMTRIFAGQVAKKHVGIGCVQHLLVPPRHVRRSRNCERGSATCNNGDIIQNTQGLETVAHGVTEVRAFMAQDAQDDT
jgi:hypothetical protein